MIKKRMIVTLICFLLGCMLFTACRKNDNENQENTSEITSTPTVTPTQTAEGTKDNTVEADTQDIKEQTGTETDYISEDKAIKNIQDIIGERGYYFELLDDNLSIKDNTYYNYQISDSDGPIEPNVLVNKVSGELLCYNSDGTTAPFSEHPLYTEPDTASETSAEGELTQDDALAQLSKVPAKDLGLPVELSEYTIIFDDWTTNIKGSDCYGINVYSDAGDKMINMGLFYVATDGSVMYKFDSSLDDFVEIKAQ